MIQTPILLASSSERRKQLLELIGLPVDQYFSPQVDETPLKNELPRQLALRLAQLKSEKAFQLYPDHIVISADSVVACGRRILDKAETEDDVRKYLSLLSGRSHRVYCAVSIRHPKGQHSLKMVETKVKFKRLSKAEIDAYVEAGEGVGKAGGYAIQGLASQFIPSIQGSYHAVMGLPVHTVYQVLSGMKG